MTQQFIILMVSAAAIPGCASSRTFNADIQRELKSLQPGHEMNSLLRQYADKDAILYCLVTYSDLASAYLVTCNGGIVAEKRSVGRSICSAKLPGEEPCRAFRKLQAAIKAAGIYSDPDPIVSTASGEIWVVATGKDVRLCISKGEDISGYQLASCGAWFDDVEMFNRPVDVRSERASPLVNGEATLSIPGLVVLESWNYVRALDVVAEEQKAAARLTTPP